MPDSEHPDRAAIAKQGSAVTDGLAHAETAARESQGIYFALLNAANQGFCTIELKFDDDMRPVDYLFLEVNPSFERQTGIKNAVGRWMHDIAPGQDQYWFDLYGRVALTGNPERLESFSTALDRWFSVYALKIDGAGRVAVLFDDVTDRKRAEADLRTSQEQFETLIDQAPLGVYLVDGDFVIRQTNPVALSVFGDIPGGVIGRDFDEVMHILWDEEYANEVVRILRHTLDTGEPYVTPERAEYRVDRNVIEYYEWRLDRIFLSSRQYGVVCYFRDISPQVEARKEIEKGREIARASEDRQAFLLKLSDAVRPLANPDEVQTAASHLLGELLKVDRATYYEIDAGGVASTLHGYSTGAIILPDNIPIADFGQQLLGSYRQGANVVVNDIATDVRFSDQERTAWRAVDMNGALGVPLIKDGRFCAVLSLATAQPRQWTDTEIALVEEVAERTWAAVERSRAEFTSKRAEARVQQLVALADVSNEFFGTCDMEFMPTYGNAAAMRMVGLADLDQVKQTPLKDFFFPEDLAFVTDEFFPRVMRDGEGKTEIRFRHFVTGEPIWVVYDVVVLKDEMGQAIGLGTVTHEITERKRTEAILRESEARFRALATIGSSTIYRMSPDWRERRELDGAGFVADLDEPTTDWKESYLPADERPRVEQAIERAIRTKDVFELEHRVFRAGGTIGRTFSRALPMLDDAGEIVEWFGVASDVTARVKADQRFTRLFEASPAPFLVLAPDPANFTIIEVNDAYLAATMRTREELVGRALFDAFPDNPNEPTSTGVSDMRASLERVLATRRPDALPGLKYDIAGPDGTFEERWWSPVNSPILDENGEVEAIIHNANDVTDDRRAEAALRDSERRAQLLLAELQHRVRNILTMVRSIARRTADTYDDPDDYARHLDGRLSSLARVQSILTRNPSRGVELHHLVLDELKSHAALPVHYQIDGPDVELSAKAAEVLSLAVHELATNSTKYGVLSGSEGKIRIDWTVDDRDGQPWLHLTWHEPFDPALDRPARTGFGTDLIRNRVPYELHGTGDIRIGDGEVDACIAFPLANGQSKLESAATDKDIGQ